MFKNISDVLRSSINVIEKLAAVEDKSEWRSIDMKRGTMPDGRRVYKLVEVKGFFSYIVSHIRCFLLASDYKKSMGIVLQAPDVDQSIKNRYVQCVNSGVISFVKNIPYKETPPAIAKCQEERGQINFLTATDTVADSDYETASEISACADKTASVASDVSDVNESEPSGMNDSDSLFDDFERITDDESDADELARSRHPAEEYSHTQSEVDAPRLTREFSSEDEEDSSNSSNSSVDVDDEVLDSETLRASTLSRETLQSDAVNHQAMEQKTTADAIHHSMTSHAVSDTNSNAELAEAIAASKNSEVKNQTKIARQEQQAENILNKYGRDIIRTVRNGNCFYDGMAKVRGHTNIMALRNQCYQEGRKCLEGNGKLQFDAGIASAFEEQINLLKKPYNYAEQLDVRLMALSENCHIVVCDLSENVACIAGPQGELEEYPATSLDEVMRQYPEAELFILATEDLHYMASRKK